MVCSFDIDSAARWGRLFESRSWGFIQRGNLPVGSHLSTRPTLVPATATGLAQPFGGGDRGLACQGLSPCVSHFFKVAACGLRPIHTGRASQRQFKRCSAQPSSGHSRFEIESCRIRPAPSTQSTRHTATTQPKHRDPFAAACMAGPGIMHHDTISIVRLCKCAITVWSYAFALSRRPVPQVRKEKEKKKNEK